GQGELLAIGGLERGGEAGAVLARVRVGPVGQRDDEVEALAEEAPAGEPLNGGALQRQSGIRHDRPCFVLETSEGGLQLAHAPLVEANVHGGPAAPPRGRDEEAGRGGPARRGRTYLAGHAELPRQRPGVDRPRPARA